MSGVLRFPDAAVTLPAGVEGRAKVSAAATAIAAEYGRPRADDWWFEAMDALDAGTLDALLAESLRVYHEACRVCGSTAILVREHGHHRLPLCRAHEGVCWKHLADPCRICDEGE